MLNLRQSRPTETTSRVSRELLAVVRILIASYFLATATGLIMEPSSRNFFDAVLPEDVALAASTIYLFVTAFAVMVGLFVRPAALMLAIYLFWSAFVHFRLAADPVALSAFWRDMALLGAVLLIALTEPGGSSRLRLRSKPIVPRRILRSSASGSAMPPRSAGSRNWQDLNSYLKTHQAEDTIAPLRAAMRDVEKERSAETGNLFGDAWERRAENTGNH